MGGSELISVHNASAEQSRFVHGWPVQFPPVTFWDELLANPDLKINGDQFWGNAEWYPAHAVYILARSKPQMHLSQDSWPDQIGRDGKPKTRTNAGTIVLEWVADTPKDGDNGQTTIRKLNAQVKKNNKIYNRMPYKYFPVRHQWRIIIIDYRRIFTMICAGLMFFLHLYMMST